MTLTPQERHAILKRQCIDPASVQAMQNSLDRGHGGMIITHCAVNDSVIEVSFTQDKAKVSLQIRPSTLADFIEEVISPEVYANQGVTMYMVRSLEQVVRLYLERNLK